MGHIDSHSLALAGHADAKPEADIDLCASFGRLRESMTGTRHVGKERAAHARQSLRERFRFEFQAAVGEGASEYTAVDHTVQQERMGTQQHITCMANVASKPEIQWGLRTDRVQTCAGGHEHRVHRVRP
jgi:hypothetical protein